MDIFHEINLVDILEPYKTLYDKSVHGIVDWYIDNGWQLGNES